MNSYLKACKHCGRSYTTKAASKAHEAECKFSPKWAKNANTRDQGAVASFIDSLWQYDIDERPTGFVVVGVVRSDHHPALRRKPTIEREDASEPFATISEAEAFIVKRKTGSKKSTDDSDARGTGFERGSWS